jgi:D-glycero-alpha-D-manno-heptose-7-phosphate kinase
VAEPADLPQPDPARGPGERSVRARSWCRVDLAGGTLDIWPLGVLHRGARTVNLAVDLPVEAEIRLRPEGYRVTQGEHTVDEATVDALAAHPETALVAAVARLLGLPPAEIRLYSASPRGGGLGASSALVVALIAAGEELLDRPRSPVARLAALGRDLEARMMSLPTGMQDHYPGLLGGVLEILHEPGGEKVERLSVDLEALGRSLVIAYTGRSHFSAGQNWQVVRRRLDGESETVELFEGIAEAARGVATALRSGDLEEAGRQMEAEWSCRRRLAEGVSTPEIENLLERARTAGAWGGKACGAGGGGSIAVLCPLERRTAVQEALVASGGRILVAEPTPATLTLR